MTILEKYLQPLREGEGVGSAGAAGGQGGAGAGTAGAPAPWHQGADGALQNFWNGKGYDLSDPVKVALEASKAALEAQKFIGAPPDQIIKLPKDASDEAGWKSVWGRLGVPADAKDYDLASVKFSDGKDLDAAFADTMRQAMLNARVPKDRAPEVIKSVVKFMEDQDAAEAADRTTKLDAERADLRRNWGQNFDRNRLAAMEGARRLGVEPETVAKLEQELGYSRVMEMFRKIGAGTNEDTFHEGRTPGGMVSTREGAAARLAELNNDKAWRDRLFAGDAQAKREFDNLTKLSIGFSDAA